MLIQKICWHADEVNCTVLGICNMEMKNTTSEFTKLRMVNRKVTSYNRAYYKCTHIYTGCYGKTKN